MFSRFLVLLAVLCAACGGAVDYPPAPAAPADAGADAAPQGPAYCETFNAVCDARGCVNDIMCTAGTPPTPDCGEGIASGNTRLPIYYHCVTP